MKESVKTTVTRPYFANLDSLRAIAAIGVIFFHWKATLSLGWAGVQFFFVLSGYLITSVLLKSRERDQGLLEKFWIFIKRRTYRLVPLYLALVLASASVAYVSGRLDLFIPDLPYLLTYSTNFMRLTDGHVSNWMYGHTWSLAVEWQFYLLWPFVIWLLSPRFFDRILWVCVILAPFARLIASLVVGERSGDFHGLVVYSLPTSHIDAFAVGGLLNIRDIRQKLSRGAVLMTILAATVLLGAVVLALAKWKGLPIGVGSIGYPNHMPYFYQYVWGYTVLNGLFAAVISGVLESRPWFAWLGHSVLHYLGRISYGIYVWHAPVIGLALAWFGAPPKFSASSILTLAAVVAATVIIASVSHEVIEKPFLRLKDESPRQRCPHFH